MGTQGEVLKPLGVGPERGRSKWEVSGKTEKGVVTQSGPSWQVLRKRSYLREIGLQPE